MKMSLIKKLKEIQSKTYLKTKKMKTFTGKVFLFQTFIQIVKQPKNLVNFSKRKK